MDKQIEAAVKYLAQCEPETRDLVVAMAAFIKGQPARPPSDDLHSGVNAAIVLCGDPIAVSCGLLKLSEPERRGRPRGAKTRRKKESETE